MLFAGDVVHDGIVTKSICASLVAAHSGADLLFSVTVRCGMSSRRVLLL